MAAEPIISTPASLPLANIAAIRALSAAEAERALPVRIRATVTFRTHVGNLFVHDGTNGAYVAVAGASGAFRPGQWVDLEGTTAPGHFAPVIQASHVRVRGEGPLPPARPVTFHDLGSSAEDCQWVEVDGIVRTASQVGEQPCELVLEVDGGRLRVYLLGMPLADAQRLVDARVVARGVRGCIFNQRRQLLAPLLFVGATNLTVREAAPDDPFALPERPLPSILQYRPDSRHGHRIKVRGQVTYQESGKSVFISDGTQGLQLQTAQQDPLEPGDFIEAVGFEKVGICSPLLEDVVYRRVSRGPPLMPVPTTVARGLESIHDAHLVNIEGTLVSAVRQGDQDVLIMRQADEVFEAQFSPAGPDRQFVALRQGSTLRLTGILLVQSVTETASVVRPESLRVLLRSPADVLVLQKAPWWDSQSILWLLLGMALLSLIAILGIVVRSRLRLREQARARDEAEAQFSAIMAERNRMAREIHDTLAQGYTAISAQLEILKDKVAGLPQAAKHLELARQFVRSSLAEARRSIWEMRSQALEEAELPEALANVAGQLTAGTEVRVDMRTLGAARRLPVVVENNLLRIGQEALANALKHAHPTEVGIELKFQEKSARLRIRDNGCGFDPARVVISQGGGFGMVGIRERVQQLGGELVVESRPGNGTEVVVEVPVA